MFFGSAVLKDSPMNAVQILWVNLIMDTFGALSLATEPPSDGILKRPPYKKTDSIMSDVMWRNVFGQAIYQCILLGFIIFGTPGTLIPNYWHHCQYGEMDENNVK